MEFIAGIDPYYRLGVALGIGLLIGTERGWHSRDLQEGGRAAGIRTFALTGLFGGISGHLSLIIGDIFLGFAIVATVGLFVTSHIITARREHPDYGITTIVAAMITFALGVMASRGSLPLAATTAVITVVLLQVKPTLHRWVNALQRYELEAATKLLLISVVILPILPNKDVGPDGIFNPFQLW